MSPQLHLSDHFSVGKLLRFTAPSMAMMLFTSIYGVVDGFFVSNFAGKTPFSAVNLIMPILMILSTVGFMLGTGGTAIVAQTLGMGKKEDANAHFSLLVYTAFALGIVFAIVGMVIIKPIVVALKAEGQLLSDAVLYGRIVLAAMPFFVLQLLFQSFFPTAEKPRLGLLVTVAAGVTNMVLDLVLVAGLPQQYKLAGAGAATAVSQVVGGCIPLVYFFRPNTSLLRLGKTKFQGSVLGRAFLNGSSEFMSNVSMSLVGMLYNIQLMHYAGQDGIAAYGVMMYVSMIFSAVFMGYTVGVSPVLGYHYGAGNQGELSGLLRRSLGIIGVMSLAMVAASQALAAPLARLFVGYDPGLMALTLSGFRIFALSFAFMGYAIYGSGFFTALGDGLTSALISFLRTLVFQIAAVLLLPLLWDIDGVWASIVVAEFMAMTLSGLFLLGKRKRFGY